MMVLVERPNSLKRWKIKESIKNFAVHIIVFNKIALNKTIDNK